jgi:ATP-dependent protease ClpP protease subunit
MATAWRAGANVGAAIPTAPKLDLVGVTGTLPDADPAIRYYDEQIARAVLAHFLNLGTQTGSWALGSTFADFFTLSLQAIADQIADIATQHIVEDLVDWNWGPDETAPDRVRRDRLSTPRLGRRPGRLGRSRGAAARSRPRAARASAARPSAEGELQHGRRSGAGSGARSGQAHQQARRRRWCPRSDCTRRYRMSRPTTRSPRVGALAGDPPPAVGVGPILALAAEGEGTSTRTTADVYVYGNIGGWSGVDADDFVRDVAALDVDQLVLHLNSPGGDAFEGAAIANVLRAHRAHVIVRVDGMAASAASVIAMAGDEVVMGIGSQMMVHDPWGYTGGNAAQVESFVRRLHSSADTLAGTYAAKAGGTAAEWREVMKAETWYTPEEAVAAKLADRVASADEVGTAEGEQITPGSSGSSWWDFWDSLSDSDRFDLSGFRYQGREHAPPPGMPGQHTPAASAAGPISHEERSRDVAFTAEQLTTMRQRLNLADDADEAAILAAIEARPEPARAALPEGTVAIEQTQLDALRNAAQRGEEARAQQEQEARERAVDAAIADGRIAPARRDHWLAALAADAGAAETLNGLEKGLVPVDGARGHDHDVEAHTESDDLYAQLWGDEKKAG